MSATQFICRECGEVPVSATQMMCLNCEPDQILDGPLPVFVRGRWDGYHCINCGDPVPEPHGMQFCSEGCAVHFVGEEQASLMTSVVATMYSLPADA